MPLTSPRHFVLRALRRTAVVAVLAGGGLLAAVGPASAHVTVHPDSYAKGAADGTLTFRVPDEEDHADTTRVQVFLPTDHPIPGVLVGPVAGWTSKVTTVQLKTPITTDDGTITEAVSEVSWTGGRIRPGQYQDFDVAFGQLPDDTGSLEFKALQTYSDGTVVRWIDQAQPGQDEPEHPAPVLTLTAAGTPSPEPATPAAPSTPAATADSASGSDSAARGLGIAALVVAALALAGALAALARSRATRG
ncbi:YcnI family protein [Streptomyces sp. V4-01]|uniref:YcnI family protein n=1 Tax=Actinacidiphila polyblastidii TaxID=3110430 RepID=A0ABU7PK10_9ACTN|nr:YcnI family protein [Streptomyces sp. V4-01]